MKLKDLKVDYILELRNGEKYKVVYNEDFGLFVKETTGKKDFIDSAEYNENLTSKENENYDIVKVTNRKNVILWSGNKENKKEKVTNKMEKILDMMDEITNIMNLNEDEDIKNETKKCRSLFEEFKNNNKENNKIEKAKKENEKIWNKCRRFRI